MRCRGRDGETPVLPVETARACAIRDRVRRRRWLVAADAADQNRRRGHADAHGMPIAEARYSAKGGGWRDRVRHRRTRRCRCTGPVDGHAPQLRAGLSHLDGVERGAVGCHIDIADARTPNQVEHVARVVVRPVPVCRVRWPPRRSRRNVRRQRIDAERREDRSVTRVLVHAVDRVRRAADAVWAVTLHIRPKVGVSPAIDADAEHGPERARRIERSASDQGWRRRQHPPTLIHRESVRHCRCKRDRPRRRIREVRKHARHELWVVLAVLHGLCHCKIHTDGSGVYEADTRAVVRAPEGRLISRGHRELEAHRPRAPR